ncbi:MAG: hypothetical protein ACK5FE_01985 [Cyanobacteriota bacterium]|jgi:hypothetical protein
MAAALPLLTLKDDRAPYKGVWSFEEMMPGKIHAFHSTFKGDYEPGCVIEQRCFLVRDAATKFARHLIIHGWGVLDLPEEGEHFWFGLSMNY